MPSSSLPLIVALPVAAASPPALPPHTPCLMQPCPAGTYCPNAKTIKAIPCPAGTFNRNLGSAVATACTKCPVNVSGAQPCLVYSRLNQQMPCLPVWQQPQLVLFSSEQQLHRLRHRQLSHTGQQPPCFPEGSTRQHNISPPPPPPAELHRQNRAGHLPAVPLWPVDRSADRPEDVLGHQLSTAARRQALRAPSLMTLLCRLPNWRWQAVRSEASATRLLILSFSLDIACSMLQCPPNSGSISCSASPAAGVIAPSAAPERLTCPSFPLRLSNLSTLPHAAHFCLPSQHHPCLCICKPPALILRRRTARQIPPETHGLRILPVNLAHVFVLK